MSRERGRIVLWVLILVALASVMFAGDSFKINKSIPPNQGQEFTPITPSPGGINQSNDTLQLKTFDFKGCSGTVTIDFLLDRTGSMNSLTPTGETKIKRLKQAVLDLTGKLDDTSVVGIQSFSSISITNDIPISYYKDVKNLIPTKVNAFQANGNTPTHDALAYSYGILQTAIPKFSNRKFNFIFISDGEPNPPSQDPRLFNPNPADQIKALGVNIFTLAVYDPTQAKSSTFSDLLKSIASKPENYYEAQNADQIASLLQKISTKLCESPATPAPTAQPVAYRPPRAPAPSGKPAPTQQPTTTCGLTTTPWGAFSYNCGPGNCVMDGPATKASDCCPGSGGQANWPDARSPYWCDAKPVIYLYPAKPTHVSVKVTIPGKITVSIPQYEPGTGWQNILAYPDGTLTYQGKNYSELFYETAQERTIPPETGWVIKTSDLKSKLTEITSLLGLNSQEQNEFLNYWLPRLNLLNKPYVFVSVFTGNEKQPIDKVDISPKPDTFIEFIMYYKGIDAPFNIKPLELPQNVPQRNGFTAVEWGGILDY